MADFDDLDLNTPHQPYDPEEPRRTGLWAALLVTLVLVTGGALYWYFFTGTERPADVRVETEDALAPPGRPDPVEGEDLALPPLDETDSLVRQLVGMLSSHPRVAAWLTTDQLIRNFTVVVINIADGQTPAKHLAAVRPAGQFSPAEEGDTLILHPRNYQRYDDYADAVAGLDPEGTARLYATLKPRIQDAAAELGHPGDFDAVLERAFVELLSTPVVEKQIELAPKSVAYDFADPRLQSLSSVQRQFLRMGPRNVRIIQTRLREIAPHLGIAPETLPGARQGAR